MPDMRLIVAGAGGRMGRTLVKAIAETPGLTLAGATEGEGSPLLGQDSGVLAGLPPNRVHGDQRSASADACRPTRSSISPFRPRPCGSPRSRPRRISRTSSAPPACRPRTTR